MPARRLLPFCFILALAVSAIAGTDDGKTIQENTLPPEPLAKGSAEVELLGSYFHSPVLATGEHRPEFDYSGADIRYGIVLSPMFFDQSIVRGNVEFLVDGFGYGVVKGAGNYLVGGSLNFRYNFIQRGSRFIPYIQLGGGGLHSDAAEDHTQSLIGGNFEFNLDATIGARILLTDHLSLLFEGGFEHISNADTASRNVGSNALGGRVGLGWLY